MDLTYIVKPFGKTDHIERPRNSEGSGSGLSRLLRAHRGRQTYCGRPIGDDWYEHNRPTRPCGTCVNAEFQEDFA